MGGISLRVQRPRSRLRSRPYPPRCHLRSHRAPQSPTHPWTNPSRFPSHTFPALRPAQAWTPSPLARRSPAPSLMTH